MRGIGASEGERLLAEELARLGRAEAELALRRKGDHRLKVSLAAKLRAQTTMTLGWIANRLQMGTRGHLTHLLYRFTSARLPTRPRANSGSHMTMPLTDTFSGSQRGESFNTWEEIPKDCFEGGEKPAKPEGYP